MQTKVAVVVLSYNSAALLQQFLPGIVATATPDTAVWVVDNASTDGTWALLQAEFATVQRIRLTVNRGFTNGYVQSLPQIGAEYYVLINSDVEVTAGWLEPLVQLMDANPDIAACQPKILAQKQKTHFEYSGAAGGYIDRWGYTQCRGRVFDTVEEDKGQYDDAREVFWATGACMLVRSSVYHALGGLDNDFYAHMEEIDLCWRMRNHGHQVWVQPTSVVHHVGGSVIRYGSTEKLYHNLRNNLWMLVKNLPKGQLWQVVLPRMILDGVAALRWLLQADWWGFVTVHRAHRDFWLGLPAVLRKRKALLRTATHNGFAGNGMLRMSTVWQYFVKGKKKFSDLHP